MAAFTSTQSGNWNDVNTWGGGGYPFQASATDTATIASGHTVTITADNVYAGTGAVSVNGVMTISNHACAQSFCGAISVNSGGTLSSEDDANVKKLWVKNGDVIVYDGGIFDWNKNSEMHFETASSSGNGIDCQNGSWFTLIGTNGTNDCKITGANGYEAWVLLRCMSTGLLHEVKNVTIDYCGWFNSSFPASLSFLWANQYNKNLEVDNVVIDHPYRAGIFASKCIIDRDFKNITVNAYRDKLFYFSYSVLTDGFTLDINHTSSANYDIAYFNYSILDDVQFSADITSGSNTNYPINLSFSHVNGGSYTVTRPSGESVPVGFNFGSTSVSGGYYSYICNSTVQNINAFVLSRGSVTGGTFISDTPGTGIYCEQTLLKGGQWTVKNTGTGAFYGIYPYMAACSKNSTFGLIIEDSCETGINNQYAQASQFFHTPDGYCVNEATVDVANKSLSQHTEPWLYVTDRSNKYFKIWFNCWPWNADDFSVTGTVDFRPTTAGGFEMSDGACVTFPEVQPWQVVLWGTVSYTESGAGTTTWEYRISNNSGASWGDWASFTSGTDLSAQTAKGFGTEVIQFRVSVTGGGKTISDLSVVDSMYDSLDGWEKKNWLMPDMEPLKEFSGDEGKWIKL